MKKETFSAITLPLHSHSRNPTFLFDNWTFTLPPMDKTFFDQGVLDIISFSKVFAEQNGHEVVAESVMVAAVAHFLVNNFPDTAAELFIKYNDQVSQDRFSFLIVLL